MTTCNGPDTSAGASPVFGVALAKAVAAGAFNAPAGAAILPEVVDHIFKTLGCCVPSQTDLFLLASQPPNVLETHAKLTTYRAQYDAGVESPMAQEEDPQVVAALLILYLRMLPHPIVPPKFYFTFLRLGAIPSPLARLRQIRILLNKQPTVSRSFISRLLTLLRATQLDHTMLAALFSRFLLRPTMELVEQVPLPAPIIKLVVEMIAQAEYLTLQAEEPSLAESASAIPEPPNEFKLIGFAMYDFDSNGLWFSKFITLPSIGAPGVLSFRAGDRIQLLAAHPDDWLEGAFAGVTGFLPAGYVDLVPVAPPSGTGRGKIALPRVGSAYLQPLKPGQQQGVPMPTHTNVQESAGEFEEQQVQGVPQQDPTQASPNFAHDQAQDQPPAYIPNTVQPPATTSVPAPTSTPTPAPAPAQPTQPIQQTQQIQVAPPSPAQLAQPAVPTQPYQQPPPQDQYQSQVSQQIPPPQVSTPQTYSQPQPAPQQPPYVQPQNPQSAPPQQIYPQPGVQHQAQPVPTQNSQPYGPISTPPPTMAQQSPSASSYPAPTQPPVNPPQVTTSKPNDAHQDSRDEPPPPSKAPPPTSQKKDKNGKIIEKNPPGHIPDPPADLDTSYIIVVVGKSALTISFVQNSFVETYDPTIEVPINFPLFSYSKKDSYRKQIVIDEQTCVLDILDTAGQEEFSAMRDKYMHTGHGFLLVFSLTCSHSYRDVPGLHNHILQVKDTNFIPLVLVGNKADLLDEYEVSAHDAIMLAESLKVPFFKTSAKLHINVEEAFFALIREIRKDRARLATQHGRQKKKRTCIFL